RGARQCAVAQGKARRGVRHARLSRLGACRAAASTRGNERAAAPDGGDAAFRPVQSRAPDLCRAEARRYREAVRTAVNSRNEWLRTKSRRFSWLLTPY